MRFLKLCTMAAAAASTWLSAGPALAQTATPSGFALDALGPAPAGDRFFGVIDGRVRGIMEGYAALGGAYASRPLRALPGDLEYVRTQAIAHAGLSLALLEAGMLAIDMPFTIAQSGDFGFGTEPGTAFGDLRLSARIGVVDLPRHRLSIATQGDLWVPTGSEDDLTGDGQVRGSPRLALSGQLDWLAYAIELGYLFRKDVDLGEAKVGSAFTFGAGLGVLLADDAVQIGPELKGHSVMASSGAGFFDASSTPVEALLGVKVRAARLLVIGLGAGPGITDAPGAAQFRAMATVELVRDERVLDADGDGLRDRFDRCPDQPGFEPGGCPASDRDGDTVVDTQDACPEAAGLVHVDRSKHGCPPPPAQGAQ